MSKSILHIPRQLLRVRGAAVAVLLALTALAGCQPSSVDARSYLRSEVQPLPEGEPAIHARVDPGTGREFPAIAYSTASHDIANPGGFRSRGDNLFTSSAAGTRAPRVTRAQMADYVTKCDTYWKLNWIRRELLAGRVPAELAQMAERARRELSSTIADGNYDTGMSAANSLTHGLVHMKADQIITQSGIDTSAVPWSQGRTSALRYVSRLLGSSSAGRMEIGSMDLTADDDSTYLSRPGHQASPGLQDAASIIVDYAGTYHASPREMMQREWQRAIQSTNRLRDQLWMMNRETNSDGNRTQVDMPSSSSSAGAYISQSEIHSMVMRAQTEPLIH